MQVYGAAARASPHRLRAVGAAQPRRARGMRQPAFRRVSQCPAVKCSALQQNAAAAEPIRARGMRNLLSSGLVSALQ